MSYLTAHPLRVAALAAGHLELVGIALVAALVLALPLGLFAARHPRVTPWVLGTLGAIYTIPSLALLAVLVRWLGLGFAPIFVALVVYAQFMLARNIVAGIVGVDPAQVDAARGLGMSPLQIVVRVEFPQALPVLIGGVRIARIRRRCWARRADLQWANAAPAADDRGRKCNGLAYGNYD